LFYASLVYARLVYARLVYASLVYASLVYARLVYASLVYASLVYASRGGGGGCGGGGSGGLIVEPVLTVDTIARRHFITLAHVKGATLCALSGIGPTLARIAGVARACVVGIRRDNTAAQLESSSRPHASAAATVSLTHDIVTRSTVASIPWLPAGGADGRVTDRGGHSAEYRGMTVKKMGFPEKDKEKKKKSKTS